MDDVTDNVGIMFQSQSLPAKTSKIRLNLLSVNR